MAAGSGSNATAGVRSGSSGTASVRQDAGSDSAVIAPTPPGLDAPSQVNLLTMAVTTRFFTELALQGNTVFYVTVIGAHEIGSSVAFYSFDLEGDGGASQPEPITSLPGPYVSSEPVAIATGDGYTAAAVAPFVNISSLGFGLLFSFDAGASSSALAASTADATNEYWSYADGSFWRAPLDGSSAPVEFASQVGPATSMAVDSTSVYWTNAASGIVLRCPISGCGATPVAIAVGQANPSGIAADAQGVYWANAGSSGAYDGSIYRWRPGDASAVCLVSGLWGPQLVVLDASYVYWAGNDLTVRRAPR